MLSPTYTKRPPCGKKRHPNIKTDTCCLMSLLTHIRNSASLHLINGDKSLRCSFMVLGYALFLELLNWLNMISLVIFSIARCSHIQLILTRYLFLSLDEGMIRVHILPKVFRFKECSDIESSGLASNYSSTNDLHRYILQCIHTCTHNKPCVKKY